MISPSHFWDCKEALLMWQAKQDKQGQFQAEQDTTSLYIKGMDT